MEIIANNFIYGDFNSSDFGLMAASFSNGDSEYELGMNIETIEEFVGCNPVPVYLGQKYTDKLNPQVTLIKNPHIYENSMAFTYHECRAVLRKLTGISGYQWMKLIDENITEELWYRARINSVSYKRVGSNIVGIILDMECDSSFAWSAENIIEVNAAANQPFYVFNNTDDINNYVFPKVQITALSDGLLSLTNQSDHWESRIKKVKEHETITLNCKNEILSSSIAHNLLLNDFNLHWIRLLPGKNEYISNMNALLLFNFRVPRKVGFL